MYKKEQLTEPCSDDFIRLVIDNFDKKSSVSSYNKIFNLYRNINSSSHLDFKMAKYQLNIQLNSPILKLIWFNGRKSNQCTIDIKNNITSVFLFGENKIIDIEHEHINSTDFFQYDLLGIELPCKYELFIELYELLYNRIKKK